MPVHVVDHPLAHDALVTLRDRRTRSTEFRLAATRLSMLLVAEAMRDAQTWDTTIDTPIGPARGRSVRPDVTVVPVLRAGLGMLDAALTLVPRARVGFIGLQRDERTAVVSQYYAKLPENLASSLVLVIDPMLATGGSAVAALDALRRAGATQVRVVCIVAAPEGLAHVERHHPGTTIYTPAIDDGLNDLKYIVPGLGDFGDRMFGTQ